MKYSKHFTRPLSAIQQSFRIRHTFPQFESQGIKRNTCSWVGTLQPSEASEVYKVKIQFGANGSPTVTILEPNLQIAKGRTRLPHVYPGNKLCLHYPKYKQWTPSQSIANTIIPWASLWLLYYEHWLIDGKWRGGGKHPDGRDQDVA